jgi:steroid delta-isomerase-like uncharacterized protein
MSTDTVRTVATPIRALVQEYFDAWERGDEQEILSYYADDVRLWLPIATLDGKPAVRDHFVRPFCAAFPGNVHEIQNLVYENGAVAVEWRFKAVHKGTFMQYPPSGRTTDVPGCSVYFVRDNIITGGNIYFNFATLVEQIGGAV